MKVSDFFQGVKEVEVGGPKIACSFKLFGININITETIIISWGIVIGLTLLVLFLTHNMKKKPEKKRQVINRLDRILPHCLLHQYSAVW